MNTLPPELFFDLVSADEVLAAHTIELAEFPEDEAATLEQFQTRHALVPELFLGAFLPSPDGPRRTLVGYVCATLSASRTLTHESMSAHDPAGTSVCLHAIAVPTTLQRRGIALALLREELYEKAGMAYVGMSEVVHGARPWYEMRKVLSGKTEAEPMTRGQDVPSQTAIPPGVLEALQQTGSNRNRPAARLLSTFSAIDDVVAADSNKYDLLCPREGCACIILKKNVGKLVKKDVVELEPSGKAPSSLLAPLPPVGDKTRCWLIRPNPMAFENIGFSKAVGQASEGPRMKLLSCADCDLGPLGWCFEGGSEYWLVSERVGYRM
ncbi:acyl-CoA N-acyltransferase [Phellopilus nigrolimitatus]|nr:acyl-CoA N-acyltransferase [Phellopilus nigrolimitatus]